MKIFAVDSSAKVAAAAVCTQEKILAQTVLDTGLTHSQTLMPLCADLLKNAGIALADLDAFAVAAGPGSFTGLRIGLAAVKGMAYALNKPCYPVSTLEALAYNLTGFAGVACPVMDARRNQVYNALFTLSPEGVVRLCDDRAISIAALAEELAEISQTVWLCGDGAQLCYDTMPNRPSNVLLAPIALRLQKASGVAAAAFRVGQAVSARELVPSYLRLPQAERERRATPADNSRRAMPGDNSRIK